LKPENIKIEKLELGRRGFIAGTLAATVGTAAFSQNRDYGQGASPTRYPDRDILVLDKRFAKYKLGNTAIQRLFTGMSWAEGPAWNSSGRYLIWSDIPTTHSIDGLTKMGM